jgi:predicted dehydrogenase
MASSSAEALELIALADAHGLVLMPGHTFLYSPPVNAVRDLIQSGELGDIYFISSTRVNLGLHQPDVSVVWDLGPHDFSILRYWLGERPHTVSASTRGCVMPEVPDVAFVNLVFPSGAIANVHLAWLAPSKLRRTVIVGSEKMVVYDDGSREPVRIHDSGVLPRDPESFGEYRLTYRTGPIVSQPIDPSEPLSHELYDFCRVVREGTEPCSSSRLGLDVVRMVEAVDRSIDANGAAVRLKESDLPAALPSAVLR